MRQCISNRPSENTSLAHSPAKNLSEPPRFLNKCLGTDETCSNRGTCNESVSTCPCCDGDAPSPLLKHKLTESKGAQSSSIGVRVSAATCHRRAPSRCMSKPFLWAKSAISTISVCGIIVPFSVFSKQIIRVGALIDILEKYLRVRAPIPVYVSAKHYLRLNILQS